MLPIQLTKKIVKLTLVLAVCLSMTGCYFVDFFKESKLTGRGGSEENSGLLGQSIGSKANGVNEAALSALYDISTTVPPAAIRPDPDLFARRMLLQYRSEGSTVARQIGSIESYRTLLGGASEDFQKVPQEEYDATSLLATYKVAEVVCEGLVNPNSNSHPGWESILPADVSDWDTNISFLAQRFIGRPSSKIDSSIITALKTIMDENHSGGSYTNSSYVPVCAALALDAESLFL